jgi:flagellar biogenesis protein FliO
MARRRLEDEAPIQNFALELTEALDDGDVMVPPLRPTARGFRSTTSTPPDSDPDMFAIRLAKALEAISSAQGETEHTTSEHDSSASTSAPARFGAWLRALDKMPPIRLPIGPAIPWRVGLPALIAIVAVMFFVSRPSDSPRADTPGVRLPAQETYAVQQQAPLFAAQVEDPVAAAPVPAATPQPIGVQEPAGMGFDFFDVGIKLAAVLGLAYGSLLLLKKTGMGGAAALIKGNQLEGMRVVSTLALAPNRSVHVLQVPGGKMLLVGATPNAVSLLAELDQDEAV